MGGVLKVFDLSSGVRGTESTAIQMGFATASPSYRKEKKRRLVKNWFNQMCLANSTLFVLFFLGAYFPLSVFLGRFSGLF